MTSDKSIPGIYEYCDRWCRTCAFTAHCRLYQEVLSVPVTPQMVAAMRRAAAAMRAMDRLMDEQMARHGRRPRQAARDRARSDTGGRRLVVAAGDYARFVVEWFEGLPRAVRRLPRTATEADPDHPVHVVAYHHVIIGLKLTRAVDGLEAGLLDDDDVQNDANGSAKVALLSMERSVRAWRQARELRGVADEPVRAGLAKLAWMAGEVDRLFPDARRFRRPGFDEAPRGRVAARLH